MKRKLAKKVAQKVARRSALRVGAKAAGKYVAGPAATAFLVAEGAPIAVEEARYVGGRVGDRARGVRQSLREKKYGRAYGRALRGSLATQFDVGVGALRTAAGALTARELVGHRKVRRSKKNPAGTGFMEPLLGGMIALRTTYLYLHWNAKDYADHLLFERLYQSLDEDIDTMAELSVGAQGPVRPVPSTVAPKDIVAAENAIIAMASSALKAGVDYDFDNFLMTLVEHRRRALYLLRQRSR